jgi:phosphate transport system substrate-binding protein
MEKMRGFNTDMTPFKHIFSSWNPAVYALAGAIVLAGCGGNTATNSSEGNNAGAGATNTASSATTGGSEGSSTRLTGAGATFPYPLYSKWFDTYKNVKGVEINYQPVGSGAGIKQLKSKTVDFGASDAVLKADEKAEMPGEVLQIPTAAGAVVVVYNLDGAPQHLKMSGDVLADIFLGKIKNWNDPRIAAANAGVKLPTRAITVARRSDGSGTTNIFTSYLKAVSPEWSSKVGAGKAVEWPVGIGGKGNDGVASTVKNTRGSIGYVELAYATEQKMSYAAIKNSAGQFVVPSPDSTTAAAEANAAALQKDITTPIVNASGAKSYPISGFTYLLVYKKQDDATKAKPSKTS